MDNDRVYETGVAAGRHRLRNRIWNVRNGDLRRITREFPTDEPLREQCALWMHALVGKHFFPDANHRTAMALLRRLLAENGVVYSAWAIDRIREARDDSHRVRREIDSVRLDSLYRRDELYDVWLSFFEDELMVIAPDGE